MVRLGVVVRRVLADMAERVTLEERGEASEGPAKVPRGHHRADGRAGEERAGCHLSGFALGEGRAQAVRSAKGKGDGARKSFVSATEKPR